MSSRKKVLVAHEWLTNWAGSEQVTRSLVEVSGADGLIVAIGDPVLAAERFPGVEVTRMWPSRLPLATTKWKAYAPVLLVAWLAKRVRCDVLVVSSHFFAHAAAVRSRAVRVIVYYHTPNRFLWRPDLEMQRLPVAARWLLRCALPPLRWLDRYAARHADVCVANSRAVAQRIHECYGLDAEVVHPPVDISAWSDVDRSSGSPRHVLWFGRLVGYKRPDLAIAAAKEAGYRLVVVGDGPELAACRRQADASVTFLGHAALSEVRAAMEGAICMIFPGEEDFGISPVEALAAGVPVVALARGGALDYVQPGRNGLLVEHQDVASFALALHEANSRLWDAALIRETAEPFSRSRFEQSMRALLERNGLPSGVATSDGAA